MNDRAPQAVPAQLTESKRVRESLAEGFVAECNKAAVELYGTDPRLASPIDRKKVVYGGKSEASALYLEPTILYPISWSDKIMEDEIFGPLLSILTYSDFGTLLTEIEWSPKPLAGYVFSRNQEAIDRVFAIPFLCGRRCKSAQCFPVYYPDSARVDEVK